MTVRPPHTRPRPRSLRSGAFCVAGAACLLLLVGPAPGGAQEPDPTPEPVDTVTAEPPTLPTDPVLRPAGDTIPGDTVPTDTLGPPPPSLPALDPPGAAAAARGVWEWDRAALRRLPDLSLLQLLQRLPGVVPVRADMVNQAEGAAIFGATAGAIRYIVDGFELDPLQGATFDPSRFPLVALERVRVERRVTGATVRLQTVSPDDPRPRTVIEAGTGDYDVQLFRGVFLAPRFLGGPLAAGFERLAADGTIGGHSSHSTGWLKWSWVRDSAGVQLEYRQSDVDRAGIGAGLSGIRRDWVMRARAARGPVTGEVYAGASRLEDERGDVVVREGSPHGGLRLQAAIETPVPLEARTALRLRDHPRLPFGQLELGLRALPLPLLAAEAELTRGWWSDGPGTESWTARAQAGPIAGVSLFSEIGGAPLFGGGPTLRVPSPTGERLQVRREGLRLGAEARRWGGSLLVAALRSRTSEVTGFDLPFEAWFPRIPGGEATGIEVIASLPTGWDPVSIDGWYVAMDAPADWLYLPAHHARGALGYHHLPLPSGNLEIFARLEHTYRSSMMVPGTVEDEESGTTTFAIVDVPAYRSTNLELVIRVLTVQAFVQWENILHRPRQHDIPGFNRPGQHILYGVKWEFVN